MQPAGYSLWGHEESDIAEQISVCLSPLACKLKNKSEKSSHQRECPVSCCQPPRLPKALPAQPSPFPPVTVEETWVICLWLVPPPAFQVTAFAAGS